MSAKEYHIGLVAWFDEDTSTWGFQVLPINGDDSPFPQMDQEVFNSDTGKWEDGNGYRYGADETAVANQALLDEAIRHAQYRLSNSG